MHPLGAAKQSIAARRDAEQAVWNAEDAKVAAQAAELKLTGVPGKEDKLNVARKAVEDADEAVNQAKAQLETVTTRCLRDVRKFKEDNLKLFEAMPGKFAKNQVDNYEIVEEEWAKMPASTFGQV